MKILLLGKFPPIQGGESNKAYFLVKELIKKGHEITIITNSLELNDSLLYQMADFDTEQLKDKGLTIYNLKSMPLFKFIPYYEPSSEYIISTGIEILSKENFDLIIGWYLLPFSSSAFSLSKIFSTKFIVQHAGSDLKRLLPHPKLKFYLEHILRFADGIFTYPSSLNNMKKLNKNTFVHRPAIPNNFNPHDEVMDLKEYLKIDIAPTKTILFLGKISKAKGIDYLLNAFKPISSEFNLLIVGEGVYKATLESQIKNEGIKNVFFHRFIPPWRIPSLTRAVKCVVIPEWNFGVEIHRSGIPLETILCGTPALVSSQIIENYFSLARFLIQINCPDLEDFTTKLQTTLDSTTSKQFLKENYETIRSELMSFDEYINSVEKDLMKIIHNNNEVNTE
ncbi:MAG: glycosyltransferase family 4 protein [Bacteroidia bacterium]|nr:glycosyltransferase family 4 protein [Bacteroidia bacterium]